MAGSIRTATCCPICSTTSKGPDWRPGPSIPVPGVVNRERAAGNRGRPARYSLEAIGGSRGGVRTDPARGLTVGLGFQNR